MADITGGGIGGKMLGTNALQSAIDKLSRTIDKMSTTYGQAKTASQAMGGAAKSIWTGKPSSGGAPPSDGTDEEQNGKPKPGNGGHASTAVKAAGLGTAFKSLANYGNQMLQTQLPMDQYVYQGALGMTGNLSQNQAALRRQAFGQNNQNLNAMATSPEDAAQMYAQLGQTAGTPLLNQTSGGRTILQSTRQTSVTNPYLSGAQAAGVMSNVYSPNTSLAFQRMGLATPRKMGTGAPRSMTAIARGMNQFWGGRTPSMKELNAAFAEGGKANISLQAQGMNEQAIQATANVMRVQNKVQAAGGNQQEADKLIQQASQGSGKAQDELQQKYGVPRSDAQSLKNLQAARTGRAADTSSSFNKGISDSTDTLQKFSKAFTDFMEKSGLQNLLGYGGGWASQLSQSVGGMGGLFAGAMGVKSAAGAVGELAGGGGAEGGGGLLSKAAGLFGGGDAAAGAVGAAGAAGGAAKFTNMGRFAKYTGVAKKAGAAAVVAGAAYGIGKTVATKQGRKQARSRADVFAATRGNKEWLKKHGTVLEKALPGQMAAVNRWQSGASGWTDEAMHNMGSFFGIDTDKTEKVGGADIGTSESDPNQRSNTGDGQRGGAAGGAQAALKFAQNVSKKHMHYQWAGVGNPSYDCSGFMGAIQLVIDGKNPKRRIFSTANFQTGGGSHKGPSGWKYHQKAAFMIGVENGGAGGGHTAGTLLGHNVESNGSGGPRVDRNNPRGYRDPLFNGDWWGYVPSGKGNGGAADPGGNTTQNPDNPGDPTTGSAGGLGGFGDEYGSSEEVSSLQSLLNDGATGADDADNSSIDKPKQGSENSPDNAKSGFDKKVGGSWRKVVDSVLQELHEPKSKDSLVLKAINKESSGNPTIVNKTDSNWLAGHPSVGLLQVIGPTFKTYAGPYKKTGPFKYGVSTNPHANIYAGANYAKHTYGSGWAQRMAAPGGYATGTKAAKTMQEKAAKDALKKLKEMPKAPQGPHRILDMDAIMNSKPKKRNIDLNFTDGAIVLSIKDTKDPQAIKQAAQDFVQEVKKLNVYQAVMG